MEIVNKNGPMTANSIYKSVLDRTKTNSVIQRKITNNVTGLLLSKSPLFYKCGRKVKSRGGYANLWDLV